MSSKEKRSYLERHKYLPLAAAIAVCVGVALAIYGRHLFDPMVPGSGDVRSHIFKIDFLYTSLKHLSWPIWNPYWYDGIPFDPFYPPGFYVLGTILAFISRNAVIAYKLDIALALVLSGLSTYFFCRKLLRLDFGLSLVSMLVYLISVPLLLNFRNGEGPDLLGWSATLFFLTVYLARVLRGQALTWKDTLAPGILLGLALLIHPFPIIMGAIAVVLFHLLRIVYHRGPAISYKSQAIYVIGVSLIGLAIGAFYWVPAVLDYRYVSAIKSFTQFAWPKGDTYILGLVTVSMAAALVLRLKKKKDLRQDWLMLSLAAAAALGFGATNYLPFGLSSLVQEFRYATIITPFFAIVLIAYTLQAAEVTANLRRIARGLLLAIAISAAVYLLMYRHIFTQPLPLIGIISFLVPSAFLLWTVSAFSVGVRPPRSSVFLTLAGGACLIIMVSVLPYYGTNTSWLYDLFSYVDNYLQPGYSQVMQSVQGGRLVVPIGMGYLTEGDSPVTFGWLWGVQTVNGPFSQGDPKFFKQTVHLEWEQRWLDYPVTRENLMQECDARYIFIRDSYGILQDMQGMEYRVINSYGKLLQLDDNVSQAATVTPILLDVNNPSEVTEFMNILMPQGYELVLVDVKDVSPALRKRFDFVMVDSPAKVSLYPGKTVYLLNNSTDRTSVSAKNSVVTLSFPYQSIVDRVFYHGDPANANRWFGFDRYPGARLTPDDIAMMQEIRQVLGPYLNGLRYVSAGYTMDRNAIKVNTQPGFTLIKDSYFPDWHLSQGSLMTTTQGFMLALSDSSSFSLDYTDPLPVKAVIVITLAALAGSVGLLIWSRGKKTKHRA